MHNTHTPGQQGHGVTDIKDEPEVMRKKSTRKARIHAYSIQMFTI